MSDSEDPRRVRELREWYGRPLGQWLLESERRELDELLPNLFGYYLVQIGSVMETYLLASSRIHNHFVIDEHWPIRQPPSAPGRVLGVYGSADALPTQSDTIDVAILPHTLDFTTAPHQVLREVERILVPEGYVVIIGFNPWSLWGGWRLLNRWRDMPPPWQGTFRSPMRIKDWLTLLGIDPVVTRFCFFRPPLQHQGMMKRLGWMERLGGRWCTYVGAAYIVVARKRVVTLTPIKPRWRPRRSLIRPDVAKPTT